MNLRLKLTALLAVVVFAVAACGPKSFVTTEKLLTTTGTEFVRLGAIFNETCALGAVPSMDPKLCADWKAFVPDYQEADREARKLWTALAVCELEKAEAGDDRNCGSKDETINTILRVKTLLFDFALKLAARQQLQHQGGN